MVSGFPEQTVERQGSLVFCVSKSSAAERERRSTLERRESVCGECPTQMLSLMDWHYNRLYLGVNDYATFTLLIGKEVIDVKVHDFRVI
jgi:hypothetical protein